MRQLGGWPGTADYAKDAGSDLLSAGYRRRAAGEKVQPWDIVIYHPEHAKWYRGRTSKGVQAGHIGVAVPHKGDLWLYSYIKVKGQNQARWQTTPLGQPTGAFYP